MEAVQTLRWQPLTLLFLVASMWWVKWPLIAVVTQTRLPQITGLE